MLDFIYRLFRRGTYVGEMDAQAAHDLMQDSNAGGIATGALSGAGSQLGGASSGLPGHQLTAADIQEAAHQLSQAQEQLHNMTIFDYQNVFQLSGTSLYPGAVLQVPSVDVERVMIHRYLTTTMVEPVLALLYGCQTDMDFAGVEAVEEGGSSSS